MTTVNGVTWHRFLTDEKFWPQGRWMESVDVYVNDRDYTEAEWVTADSRVRVEGGLVYDWPRKLVARLPDHLEKWLALQRTRWLVVEIPATELEELESYLRSRGGSTL